MNTFTSYGKVAHYDGKTLILDGVEIGAFKGLKEAKEYCDGLQISKELHKIIEQKEPVVLTEERIAFTLSEVGELKAKESTVSLLKELIENRNFVPSQTLVSLREQMKDSVYPGKIDYVMKNGDRVLLDIETNIELNKSIDLRTSSDLIEFMTQNSTNFVLCVEQLLEDL